MSSLPLILEKIEKSHVKIIPVEKNLLLVLCKFDLEQYDIIAVMSPSIDQIRKIKEQRGAAIWFGSFDIAEEEIVAGRLDIGEGSLDMAILGVYILFLQEKQKQESVREDGPKL